MPTEEIQNSAQKLDRDKNTTAPETNMRKETTQLIGVATIILAIYNFLTNGSVPMTLGTFGLGLLLLVSS